MSQKLSKFNNEPIKYIETMEVTEGVICDIYEYTNTVSKDLAIITVKAGHSTPRQKVILGEKTIEGYVSGEGTLTISDDNTPEIKYEYSKDDTDIPNEVTIGQVMQWTASGNMDLCFYEICQPPYKDGRYENLT